MKSIVAKKEPRPPQVVHVSWCTGCREPIIADRNAAIARRTSCPTCPLGVGFVKVARYQHAPGKKRGARKRQKAWKR